MYQRKYEINLSQQGSFLFYDDKFQLETYCKQAY